MTNVKKYYQEKLNTIAYLNNKNLSNFEFIAIERRHNKHSVGNFMLHYFDNGLKSINVENSENIFLDNTDVFFFINEDINFNYRGYKYNAVYIADDINSTSYTLILYIQYDYKRKRKILKVSYFYTKDIKIDYTNKNFDLIDEL